MVPPNKIIEQVSLRDGILSVPSLRYGEERSGAIFGFFHIELITPRQVSEEREVHRHPDFDQLGILRQLEASQADRSVQL